MRTCRTPMSGLLVGLLLGLLLGLLQVPVTAQAACADLSRQQARRADAVFVGTVGGRGGASATVRVRVSDVYKGAVDATVHVRSGDPGAEDAVTFEPGRQYLFVVQGERSRWSARPCGGTTPVTDRSLGTVEDLLGAPTSFRGVPRPAGKSPQSTPESTPESTPATTPTRSPSPRGADARQTSQDDGGGYLVIGLLAAALVASFALPQLRRRRRRGSGGT